MKRFEVMASKVGRRMVTLPIMAVLIVVFFDKLLERFLWDSFAWYLLAWNFALSLFRWMWLMYICLTMGQDEGLYKDKIFVALSAKSLFVASLFQFSTSYIL